jgi:hypothetical protein
MSWNQHYVLNHTQRGSLGLRRDHSKASQLAGRNGIRHQGRCCRALAHNWSIFNNTTEGRGGAGCCWTSAASMSEWRGRRSKHIRGKRKRLVNDRALLLFCLCLCSSAFSLRLITIVCTAVTYNRNRVAGVLPVDHFSLWRYHALSLWHNR